jgi:hypothetical protein
MNANLVVLRINRYNLSLKPEKLSVYLTSLESLYVIGRKDLEGKMLVFYPLSCNVLQLRRVGFL